MPYMAGKQDLNIVTFNELDPADVGQVTDNSKLLIETSDGRAKSVLKSVLFNEEAAARAEQDSLLQEQIDAIVGAGDLEEKMNLSLKGANNGVAELDENGKIPMSQIPGGADDVRDCYGVVTWDEFGNVTSIQVYEDAEHTRLLVAEPHIIYLDIGDTASKNYQYMWTGTAWSRLGNSVVIGESSSNAYRGDRGKIAYDHSQVRGTGTETAANPHALAPADIGLGNVPNVTTNNQTPTYTVPASDAELTSGETLSVAFGKLAKIVRTVIAHIVNVSNPHSVTKAQVGLGDVENYGRSTLVVSGDDKYVTGGAVYTAVSDMGTSVQSSLNASKQDKSLSAPVLIDGTSAGTVELAITELNDKKADKSSVTACINELQPKITGAATSILTDNLTAEKVLVSDLNGKVGESSVTAVELGYLSGATDNLQSQINSMVSYVQTLPESPKNKIYGIPEKETVDETLEDFTAKYLELDTSVIPNVYRPKSNVLSTSLFIGIDEGVNVITVSADYTSVNGNITTTKATQVSGNVIVQKFYAGNSAECRYFRLGNSDTGSGNIPDATTICPSDTNCDFPLTFYDYDNTTFLTGCHCDTPNLTYNPACNTIESKCSSHALELKRSYSTRDACVSLAGSWLRIDSRYDCRGVGVCPDCESCASLFMQADTGFGNVSCIDFRLKTTCAFNSRPFHATLDDVKLDTQNNHATFSLSGGTTSGTSYINTNSNCGHWTSITSVSNYHTVAGACACNIICAYICSGGTVENDFVTVCGSFTSCLKQCGTNGKMYVCCDSTKGWKCLLNEDDASSGGTYISWTNPTTSCVNSLTTENGIVGQSYGSINLAIPGCSEFYADATCMTVDKKNIGSLQIRSDGVCLDSLGGTLHLDQSGNVALTAKAGYPGGAVIADRFTSDGSASIHISNNNELNIIPGSGTATWINYRGGSNELYIGNGDASSDGWGTLHAALVDSTLSGRIMMNCGYCATGCNFMPYSGTSGVYGMSEGIWAHFLTFSHGDFDSHYGSAIKVPFFDTDRWTWRTRNYGTLGGIHELLDNRGNQTVYGGVCYSLGETAAGTNLAFVKGNNYTAVCGYNGGAYLGHLNAAYDGYWGFATVGFYNAETGALTPNICMAREGYVFFNNGISSVNAHVDTCLYGPYGRIDFATNNRIEIVPAVGSGGSVMWGPGRCGYFFINSSGEPSVYPNPGTNFVVAGNEVVNTLYVCETPYKLKNGAWCPLTSADEVVPVTTANGTSFIDNANNTYFVRCYGGHVSSQVVMGNAGTYLYGNDGTNTSLVLSGGSSAFMCSSGRKIDVTPTDVYITASGLSPLHFANGDKETIYQGMSSLAANCFIMHNRVPENVVLPVSANFGIDLGNNLIICDFVGTLVVSEHCHALFSFTARYLSSTGQPAIGMYSYSAIKAGGTWAWAVEKGFAQ